MKRISILQNVVDKKITQKEAAQELNLSDRRIRQIKKNYKTQNVEAFLCHYKGGNRAFKAEFKESVKTIVHDPLYKNFGPTFMSEKLQERHGLKVNRETLRQWMMEWGLWHGKKRKTKKVHQSRLRRPCEGEMEQIDGSYHAWFEDRGPSCCLLVFIDDATSKIMFMMFCDHETTESYAQALKGYILKHGVPFSFYSDKFSVFVVNQKNCHEKSQTQFQRMLKALNIEQICAHSPQAKGRVERANGTMQDRLIKELRLRNISDIESANAYLPEFIEAHNQRFAVQPASPENRHRKWTAQEWELDLIVSIQEERTLSKDLECSFEGHIYQVHPLGSGFELRQAKITIHKLLGGEIVLMYKGRWLEYSVIAKTRQPHFADSKALNATVDRLLSNSQKALSSPISL